MMSLITKRWRSAAATLLIVAATVSAAGAQAQVTGLQLVRANTGELVANLVSGSTIYLNGATPSLTVVALTSPSPTTTNVRFGWNSQPRYRTDRFAPYTLCGGSFAGCTELTAGSHTVTATVVNTTVPYTVTFVLDNGAAPSFSPVRINCGSLVPFVDSLGRTWSADTAFTGGYTFDSAVAIADTVDDSLFNCERYGQTTYSIAVPAGTYTVTLLFAEIFHTAAGKRIFDVSVEGQAINDIDIVQLGGGVAFKAITRVLSGVSVSDGFLTIQLFDNVPLVDFPKLSAIEVTAQGGSSGPPPPIRAPVVPMPTPVVIPTPVATQNFVPVRINCGALAPFVDALGRTWSADTFFTGGYTFDSAVPIEGTVDDSLYNCERYGQATYAIPVPPGSYTVTLHLAEIYHTAANKRVFDVTVEGQQVNDIDIVQLGGGVAFKAITRVLSGVSVSDGFLTIQLFDNVPLIDFPKLSAIEVTSNGSPPAPIKAPVLPPNPIAPSSNFVPVRINCGSLVPFVDSLGRTWSADTAFTGGFIFDSAVPIEGTVDDSLYNCERYGHSMYSIAVPPGSYSVTLHYAEIFHTAAGKRLFDVSVEGQQLNDIDIVQIGGGVAFKAITQVVSSVAVNDGFLTIKFMDNVPLIDFPKISGIEVVQSGVRPPTKAPIKFPTKAPVKSPTKAPIKSPMTPVGGPSAFEPILINCGGTNFVDSQRRVWIADDFFTGGQTYVTAGDIADTEDDTIYNANRWGQVKYEIPIPAGTYQVLLHFSETHHAAVGSRVFDVEVESTELSNIDIVQLGQGIAKKAITQVTSAVVSDGFLTIQMKDNVPLIDFPTIAGIEVNRLGVAPPVKAPVAVIPTAPPAPSSQLTFQPVRISCGSGSDYTDKNGKVWKKDQYSQGGSTFVDSSNPIAGTEDDALFQSDRWGGTFSYNVPVPEGNYRVVLWFSEIYYLFTKPGARVFDVTIEGGDVLADIDIVKEAGAIYTATKRESFIIPVVDGVLNIEFASKSPAIDNPKISAIEVIKTGDHFSHAVIGGPYQAVDLDASGSELVRVDATESHTHGNGNSLISYSWLLGTTVIGTGKITNLNLPVGSHEVSLTVTDNTGSVSTDRTTISVKVKGFPELFSLSPRTGGIAGGTTVTVKGQDIGAVTAVKFGRATVTGASITVIDSSTITVVTPEAAIGVPVEVSVVTPVGESTGRTFTYVSSTPIDFAIQKLLDFAKPTAMAFGPDGKLYIGSQGGKLARITLNDSYDAIVPGSAVISDRFPDNKDMCVLGIAFDPMETAERGDQISVYISLSEIYHGQFKNSLGLAVNGKIQVIRGANLDQVANVVTGLPISEIDHAVNGIHFGDNGELYIAVGGNTNAGLPGALSGSERMRENYFSAAILVANLAKPGYNGFITYDADIDGSPVTGFGPNGVEVFGSGLRNPYGVLFHSNGNVYATDNGSNKELGKRATGCAPGQETMEFDVGDELNLVKRGNYYGHPNHKRAQTDPRQCVWRSSDDPTNAQHTGPILKVDSSTDGIIEFEADHFNGQMRGDLILSKYSDGLFRVVLSPDGQSVNPFSDPMIRLSGGGGLTVTQAPNGNLVDARHGDNACFVISPKEVPSPNLDIKAVFPRRGGLAGGSKLMIFGVNFSGSPTVTVGGNPCTNVSVVSSTKIECRLPMGAIGKKDIVVQIGATSDTFAKGYRYITGLPA